MKKTMIRLLRVKLYVFGVLVLLSACVEGEPSQKTLYNTVPYNYNGPLPLTVSEEDDLRRGLFACWVLPIGSCDLENMSTTVTVKLEKTGRIISTKVHDNPRYRNNSCYKMFADSVLRVFTSCNPLKYIPPPEKYGNWKEMEITFTPKDMY